MGNCPFITTRDRNQAHDATIAAAREILKRYGVTEAINAAIKKLENVAFIDISDKDDMTVRMIKRAGQILDYTIVDFTTENKIRFDFSTKK